MNIPREKLLMMYERMLKIREFEDRVRVLFAEGELPGFVHLYLGEEAVAVGACAPLNDDDYITSTHRGHGHIIAKETDCHLAGFSHLGRHGRASGDRDTGGDNPICS